MHSSRNIKASTNTHACIHTLQAWHISNMVNKSLSTEEGEKTQAVGELLIKGGEADELYLMNTGCWTHASIQGSVFFR